MGSEFFYNEALYIGSFLIVVLASKMIGEFLARFNFPLISGYLLAGIVVGPFVLQLIPSEAIDGLRFIDELSLAFIAFAAGSELYIEEIRHRLRSIGWHTISQIVSVYVVGSIGVYLLADLIPFMRDLPTAGRIAVALLASSILLARSPSSAIAIINELRARGPFTKTVLGVTVVKDVVVVVLFALSISIADVLIAEHSFDLVFVLLLLVELALAVVLGWLVYRTLHSILSLHAVWWLKTGMMLLLGLGVFVFSAALRQWTHEQLPFEILVEPLLVCMIGSFWLTNRSPHRMEFREILERVGPVIYVMFFTLVGDALALDVLATVWPVALALFAIRLAGLFVGGWVGGALARDPGQHRRLVWMAYITQAGVGLGLAKEVAVEFPQFGEQFATVLISVIVLSQLVGPPFMKFAIRRVGEAHLPPDAEPDKVRDALILGVGGQSIALARRLATHNWQVVLADTDRERMQRAIDDGLDVRFIPDVTFENLSGLMTNATDAVVTMLNDDENLKACEIVRESFGIQRLIVKLNDLSWVERFQPLDAQLVYPATAIVHLLDQFVRAPHSAAMLMHADPEHAIQQITITNPDIAGLPLRDIQLPSDVIILGIMRDEHSIVPHGYTILRIGDDVTIVGSPESLESLTLRFGF